MPADSKPAGQGAGSINLPVAKAKPNPRARPPEEFEITPINLLSLHLPTKKAPKTAKLNADYKFHGDKLLVNKHFHFDKDYSQRHGTRTSYGYIYRGKLDTHWHHCIWDPNCACFYFFDPYSSSYYYWNEDDDCYYPCWWEVDFAALIRQ